MRGKNFLLLVMVVFMCVFLVVDDADAAKRRKRKSRRRYSGPPPTHPVVLWSRTLAESTDKEERKIAAFKLSQYSQTIYQTSIIHNLVRCMKDTDVQIKVLCAKAMGRAGTQSQAEGVRKSLLETYKADPTLRNTIVRTFTARKDATPKVQETFLKSLESSSDQEEMLALLGYFEDYGDGNKLADALPDLYKKHENVKIRRAVVKVLGARADGQDEVVALLASCSDSKDTPLALNCLSGLQSQARTDARAWPAVQKAIESSDPDVMMATLDVINSLPESPKKEIGLRLVEIIDDIDDSEIQEKAVLALGVCGDHSETVVNALASVLEDKGIDEGVRIAAALVMGKQADQFPEKPKNSLAKCLTEARSPSLRTACTLGQQELEKRKAIAEKNGPKAENATASPSPQPRDKAETANRETDSVADQKEEAKDEPETSEAIDGDPKMPE